MKEKEISAEEWLKKGLALGESGRHEDAIAAYDRAIEIDPGYAEAWNNFDSAVSSAPAYPIPILWKVYARYLRVEASINPEKPEERGSARTEP